MNIFRVTYEEIHDSCFFTDGVPFIDVWFRKDDERMVGSFTLSENGQFVVWESLPSTAEFQDEVIPMLRSMTGQKISFKTLRKDERSFRGELLSDRQTLWNLLRRMAAI